MSDSPSAPIQNLPNYNVILVMGAMACGKTSFATQLEKHLKSLPTVNAVVLRDADDLHPESNKDKMRRGIPLTDADRAPWLAAINNEIKTWLSGKDPRCSATPPCAAHKSITATTTTAPYNTYIIACSALKQDYRALLAGRGGSSGGGSDEVGVTPQIGVVYLRQPLALAVSRACRIWDPQVTLENGLSPAGATQKVTPRVMPDGSLHFGSHPKVVINQFVTLQEPTEAEKRSFLFVKEIPPTAVTLTSTPASVNAEWNRAYGEIMSSLVVSYSKPKSKL